MDIDALASTRSAFMQVDGATVGGIIEHYLSYRPALEEFASHEELRAALGFLIGWAEKRNETELLERATFVREDVRRLLVEVEEIARLSAAALEARRAALAEVAQTRAAIIKARADAIADVVVLLDEHIKSGTRALALTIRAGLDTLRTKP